ncbi:MAG: glycosyltransferase family 9 protein [Myxococcota bacterium]|nr:glycosyltransferase family 9 protein [Myxococcota bacterium]
MSASPRARRILIIRLGAMGDVVRTLPAFRALRSAYPEARISWLVERGAEGILSGRPDLDDVIRFPRQELASALRGFRVRAFCNEARQFIAQLRGEQFDLVVDFHAILKSGVLARLSGAATRVSYAHPFAREGSWVFATDRARLAPAKMSRYDRNQGLLEFMNVRGSVQGPPIRPRSEAREHIAQALSGEEVRVLIHPGSSGGASYKRYPALSYADVARKLYAARNITSMVTLGSNEEEQALAKQIVAASGGAAKLAPQTRTLAELTAMIGYAGVFVGSDSGPLHIATSVGTPAIQIMGPTDPIENEPRRDAQWRRVRVPVACSPCRRGCAQATCMSVIPHELVVEAVLECLGTFRDQRRVLATRPHTARPRVGVQPWT